jgi:hypothetical protein
MVRPPPGTRSNRPAGPSRLLPNLGVNTCPLFFSKACMLKNNSKDDKTVVDHFYAMGDFHRNRPWTFKHLALHLDRTSSNISHWVPWVTVVPVKTPPYKNFRSKLSQHCMDLPNLETVTKLVALGSYRQNSFPNQISYLKRLSFYSFIIVRNQMLVSLRGGGGELGNLKP